MTDDVQPRRLATIVALDVAGYSARTEVDEAKTAAEVASLRKVIDAIAGNHSGRVFNTAGDGFMLEFGSSLAAVEAAFELAETCEPKVRIGVHLGDVAVQSNGDLLGHGVNVAARLMARSEPGSALVSNTVRQTIRGPAAARLVSRGTMQLDKMAETIEAFAIVAAMPESVTAQMTRAEPLLNTLGAVSAHQRPTVAILPFENLSGDPQEEYFSDGITADVVATLAKHRWLSVVARNTTARFKGRKAAISDVARETGADYVVEGSVRRAGDRVRVNVQLIAAQSGNCTWAERYDRESNDLFDIQDDITQTIAARIEPEIGFAERRRIASAAGSRDLRAWECFHLGLSHFFKFTGTDNRKAQEYIQKSRDLDPTFGDAHAWWAYAVVLGTVYWDTEPSTELLDRALAATTRALEIDGQNSVFYALKARVQLARGEYESAIEGNKLAVELNPSFAAAHCGFADSLTYLGRYDEAIERFEKAIALSTNDPQRWAFFTYGALALILKKEFERALEWAERAAALPNRQYWTLAHKAVALAYLGRDEAAQRAFSAAIAEQPELSVGFARKRMYFLKRSEQLEFYLEGLKRAGAPAEPPSFDAGPSI